MNLQKSKIIIIAGPSGAGKGSILKGIFSKFPQLALSISATTRAIRHGEVHGQNYYFLNHEEFQEKINNNEFLEYKPFSSNIYGTLNSEIYRLNEADKIPVLEIELEGVKAIIEKSNQFELLKIFIMPPSIEILERRLKNRNTDNIEQIIKRLETAQYEIDFVMNNNDFFDYIIENKENELDNTIDSISKIIENFINK